MTFREDPATPERPDDPELSVKVKRDRKAREAIVALERGGRLTPAQVLEAAENPDSPLHSYFEWNDDKAAHAHRIAQARSLIRVVRLVITVEETVLAVPRYVRDPAAGPQQGYVTVEQLRQEPDNAAAQVSYELTRALGCVERAANLAVALTVEADVANALRVLRRALNALRHPESVA